MFKDRLKKMNKTEKKEVMEAVNELSKNPFKGHPLDPEEIETMPWEKCDCEKPLFIYRCKNCDEFYFNCVNHKCDGFWMTRKQLIRGRKEHVKKMVASFEPKVRKKREKILLARIVPAVI